MRAHTFLQNKYLHSPHSLKQTPPVEYHNCTNGKRKHEIKHLEHQVIVTHQCISYIAIEEIFLGFQRFEGF